MEIYAVKKTKLESYEGENNAGSTVNLFTTEEAAKEFMKQDYEEELAEAESVFGDENEELDDGYSDVGIYEYSARISVWDEFKNETTIDFEIERLSVH